MPFGSLWIPVVVSAVVVFAASCVLHMLLTYHRADYKALPNEEAVRDALRKGSPSPGYYMTPYCGNMKQMQEPAMKEKFEKGPIAMISIAPNGLPAMPKFLGQWFGYCFLVSFVTAYVARHTLLPGTNGWEVLRITGTVAFAGFALAHISDSIWKGQPWSNTARALLDGVIYAVLTGLTFRLLWPGV